MPCHRNEMLRVRSVLSFSRTCCQACILPTAYLLFCDFSVPSESCVCYLFEADGAVRMQTAATAPQCPGVSLFHKVPSSRPVVSRAHTATPLSPHVAYLDLLAGNGLQDLGCLMRAACELVRPLTACGRCWYCTFARTTVAQECSVASI